MTRDSPICGTEHSFCGAGGFVKGFRLSGEKWRKVNKLYSLNREADQDLNSKLNELEARHSHEGLHGCAWHQKQLAIGKLQGPSLHLVSPDFP